MRSQLPPRIILDLTTDRNKARSDQRASLPPSVDPAHYNIHPEGPPRWTRAGELLPPHHPRGQIDWGKIEAEAADSTVLSDIHCHMQNYTGRGHWVEEVVRKLFELGIERTVLMPIPTTLVSALNDDERYSRYGKPHHCGEPYYIPAGDNRPDLELSPRTLAKMIELAELRPNPRVDANLANDVYEAVREGWIKPEHLDKLDLALTGLHLGDPNAPKDMLDALWDMKIKDDALQKQLGPEMKSRRIRFGLVGEVTLEKEIVKKLFAGKTQADLKANITPTAQAMRLAGAIGMPWVLHCDIDVPEGLKRPWERNKAPKHLEDIKKLMRAAPNTQIVWAHAGGLGRFVKAGKNHLNLLRGFMADPSLKHVKLDISWSEVAKQIIENPESVKEWAQFLVDHKDRILFGSDTLTPQTAEKWTETYDMYKGTLLAEMDRLEPDVPAEQSASHRIRLGNYDDLMLPAREHIDAFTDHVLPLIKDSVGNITGPDVDVEAIVELRNRVYREKIDAMEPGDERDKLERVLGHFNDWDNPLPRLKDLVEKPRREREPWLQRLVPASRGGGVHSRSLRVFPVDRTTTPRAFSEGDRVIPSGHGLPEPPVTETRKPAQVPRISNTDSGKHRKPQADPGEDLNPHRELVERLFVSRDVSKTRWHLKDALARAVGNTVGERDAELRAGDLKRLTLALAATTRSPDSPADLGLALQALEHLQTLDIDAAMRGAEPAPGVDGNVRDAAWHAAYELARTPIGYETLMRVTQPPADPGHHLDLFLRAAGDLAREVKDQGVSLAPNSLADHAGRGRNRGLLTMAYRGWREIHTGKAWGEIDPGWRRAMTAQRNGFTTDEPGSPLDKARKWSREPSQQLARAVQRHGTSPTKRVLTFQRATPFTGILKTDGLAGQGALAQAESVKTVIDEVGKISGIAAQAWMRMPDPPASMGDEERARYIRERRHRIAESLVMREVCREWGQRGVLERSGALPFKPAETDAINDRLLRLAMHLNWSIPSIGIGEDDLTNAFARMQGDERARQLKRDEHGGIVPTPETLRDWAEGASLHLDAAHARLQAMPDLDEQALMTDMQRIYEEVILGAVPEADPDRFVEALAHIEGKREPLSVGTTLTNEQAIQHLADVAGQGRLASVVTGSTDQQVGVSLATAGLPLPVVGHGGVIAGRSNRVSFGTLNSGPFFSGMRERLWAVGASSGLRGLAAGLPGLGDVEVGPQVNALGSTVKATREGVTLRMPRFPWREPLAPRKDSEVPKGIGGDAQRAAELGKVIEVLLTPPSEKERAEGRVPLDRLLEEFPDLSVVTLGRGDNRKTENRVGSRASVVARAAVGRLGIGPHAGAEREQVRRTARTDEPHGIARVLTRMVQNGAITSAGAGFAAAGAAGRVLLPEYSGLELGIHANWVAAQINVNLVEDWVSPSSYCDFIYRSAEDFVAAVSRDFDRWVDQGILPRMLGADPPDPASPEYAALRARAEQNLREFLANVKANAVPNQTFHMWAEMDPAKAQKATEHLNNATLAQSAGHAEEARAERQRAERILYDPASYPPLLMFSMHYQANNQGVGSTTGVVFRRGHTSEQTTLAQHTA